MKNYRDEQFPASAAQLMAQFERCATNNTDEDILNAALQLLAKSIMVITKEQSGTLPDAVRFISGRVTETLTACVASNWDFTPTSTSIPVKAQ